MMLTHSGRLVDPLNIDFSKVLIEDIAWALDGAIRWGGHTEPRFTVAQHTLACANAAYRERGPRAALLALHHDDGEAFFGDMCRGLKNRPEMAWFKKQEEACTLACIRHFAPEISDMPLSAIKAYDNASLLTELARGFPADRDEWHGPSEVPLDSIFLTDDWGRDLSFAQHWVGSHCWLKAEIRCTL